MGEGTLGRSSSKRLPSPGALLFPAAALLSVVVGYLQAHRLRWICDDAFITLRYAENWIGGHGLVYNAGERVEGYTHFLWLCLIALLQKSGMDPVLAAESMGRAASLLTIALCLLATRLLSGRAAMVPFAALALALHYDYAVWATGGLETSLFTCELLAAFLLLSLRGRPGSRRLILAGSVLAVSVMTRPDGVVLLTTALIWVGIEGRLLASAWRPALRRSALFLLPSLLLLLPYAIWKYGYYGHLLPNTYFAKSAGSSYFGQGFRYLWVYFRGYPSSLLFLLAIPLLFHRRLNGRAQLPGRVRSLDDPSTRFLLLGLLWIASYLILFVARVGGDFMYARFVVPMLPLLYLTGEVALRRVVARWPRALAIVLLTLPLLLLAEKPRRDALFCDRPGGLRSSSGPYDISDEHWYYTHEDGGLSLSQALRSMGQELRPCFDGLEARVLLRGQATMGYYAHFAYCLDESGLTDPFIARQRLERRGRPGHEKSPPLDYLARQRIHFLFLKKPYLDDPYRFAYFQFGSRLIRAEMFTYDRELLGRLKQRLGDRFRFIDFEVYLDDWLAQLPQMPKETAEKEYARFRSFYFQNNPDPEREERIQSYLSAKGGS